MHAVLEAQGLALGAMQQACARQPGVHAHQLCALERERALCASAASLGDYQRASGGGFELARAAWLDRVAGRWRTARAVGDRYTAQAAVAEFRGALAARHLGDWTDALSAAALEAAPWRARSAQAGVSLTRTVLNLLLHHSCTPPQADHWGDALGAWRTLCTVDPAAARDLHAGDTWPGRVAPRLPWRDGAARAWLQRVLAALPSPPAAPFGDKQGRAPEDGELDADLADPLAALSDAWRRSLRDSAPMPPAAASPADPAWDAVTSSAEQARAPWHHLAEPAPGAPAATLAMAAVAQRLLILAAGAGTGPDVQRCAIESGLLTELAAAPLRAHLAEIEKRQRAAPQPLLAAHARSLRADLTQAGTATEVELLSTHADACLDIEADWQSLFFAAQGAPLGAALNFALSPTEAERGLRGASVICSCLLGQAPAATLHSALVQAVLQRHLAENAFGTGSDAVAWRGETGHGLLPLLSAWRAVAASRGVAVPQDRTGLTAALQPMTGLEPDATASAPPVVVQLWGQRADARDAAQLLAAPGRPALPLWQGPGDASDAV